jgi:nicotinate-nucleotide pyrophosphorylase (carboxylating)
MRDINSLSLPEAYAALAATGLVTRALELARDEDLGGLGDITSDSCISEVTPGAASMVARRPGVIAGLATIPELIRVFGAGISCTCAVDDGTAVPAGTVLAELSGPLREILALERTALNLVGRLSGIATLTGSFVAAAAGTRAGIFDTRKTTPGLRVLEKYAVRCGGGRCHRLGLFDAVLIKDNHLAGVPLASLAEFVRDSAARARTRSRDLLFVEVEVDTLEQLEAVLTLPKGTVDVVLLDNMTPETMRCAVALRDGSTSRPELEGSGGVRLNTVGEIARAGVERISVGALTHSAPALDVAMDIAS